MKAHTETSEPGASLPRHRYVQNASVLCKTKDTSVPCGLAINGNRKTHRKAKQRGTPGSPESHIFRGHGGGWLHSWTHQVLYLRSTNPKYSPPTWVTISVTYQLEMKAEAVLAVCQGNTDLSLKGTSAASYHPCETKQCCDTGANHSEQSLRER